MSKLQRTLSFVTKSLNQIKKSNAHLIITNIFKFSSIPNIIFLHFDGVRLKTEGIKERVFGARMIKNIVNGSGRNIRLACARPLVEIQTL